jgi:aspartyl-tRNA(Asn)/glutamyl-tRNA(Gln) amidotransferase subunit A
LRPQRGKTKLKLNELNSLTILEIAQLFRTQRSSPVEVVRLLLDQIRRTEDKVKAYVTVCEENALKLAEIAEAEIRSSHNLGPLHGIPISIKDIFETEGVRTTCGSKLLSDYVPKHDSTVVRRLKSAGAILLGKTNTHEFALGCITPPTRNPWDLNRIPGGSSGGSAAALAASSAIATTGSDTGGSIRIPASFCGVVGLKPTYCRVSRAGIFPQSWSLDTAGPITARVEDAALLLSIMAGRDELDPSSSCLPVPDYLTASKESVSGLTIGIPSNFFFDHCQEQVLEVVRNGIDTLKGMGCSVVEFEFPHISEFRAAQAVLELVEPCAYHTRALAERPEDFAPDSRMFLEQAMLIPAVHYIQALRFRTIAYSAVSDLMKHFDAIVTPTEPMVACEVGEQLMKFDDLEEDINLATGRYVAPFNLVGLPAISVPCGFSSNGLPIGMQIVGKAYDEATILRIARAYEQKAEWYKQHPQIE